MPPFFSIVTPSYNQGRFLRETMQSLHGQKDANVEHIVWDNLSTDETGAVLEEYKTKCSVVREKDAGQADAINKGWKKSTGQWMAWLNADDLYEPGALAKVKAIAEKNPSARWIVGCFRIIDEKGKPIGGLHSGYKNFLLKRYSYNLLLSENIVPQMSVFIRRDLWEEAGELKIDDPLAFDYEYWLRLGKIATPAILPEAVSAFRYHSGSKTAQGLKTQFAQELEYARQYAGRACWPIALHKLNYYKTIWFYDLVKKI